MTVNASEIRTVIKLGNDVGTVFSFSFTIYAASDLEVIFSDTLGVETVLSEGSGTTDYSVSASSFPGTGSITYPATLGTELATGEKLTIRAVQPIEQLTDLENQGGYFAEVQETQFDKVIRIAIQQQEELDRTPKIQVSDQTTTLEELTADIQDLADIQTEITTVAGISGDVTTVSGISADVTTVAGISADVTAVSVINADVTTVAGDSAVIVTVAGISADVTTVAGISSDVTTVSTINANVTTVAGISANVTTVAGISGNVTTVAGISSDVTTVAGISADITTVAADGVDIGVVSGISADVVTVSGISANVTTVAGISADVTTVAGDSVDIATVAAISADVSTVASVSDDVTAVAAQVTGWNFSTTTAMADPGSGNMRFNNATPSSVTAIAVDDLDSSAVDVSAYVISWDDSTSTNKGTLIVRQGPSLAIFIITGLTDNAGWTQLAVTFVTGSGSFSDATLSFVGFVRTGDKGTAGAGSGDVLAPGSTTEHTLPIWDSVAKTLKDGPAVGTAGQVMTSNGASADPSMQNAAGGGAWTLIGTVVASTSATLTVTGLDSTYDTYAIAISDVIPSNDIERVNLRLGTSGGIEAGNSYSFHRQSTLASAVTYAAISSQTGTAFGATNEGGTTAGEGCGALLFLHTPGDASSVPLITGTNVSHNHNSIFQGGSVIGGFNTVIAVDRVQILMSSGNIASGRLTVWGIKHA